MWKCGGNRTMDRIQPLFLHALLHLAQTPVRERCRAGECGKEERRTHRPSRHRLPYTVCMKKKQHWVWIVLTLAALLLSARALKRQPGVSGRQRSDTRHPAAYLG